MLKKLDHRQMGKSNLGWLKSLFHFSFAAYYNPDNMGFGVLRVLNDDLIEPHTGFDMHPHKDMEIVSYVIQGELTHKDSMGNASTLGRGHVQYMSAGTGIVHSENNLGLEEARLLQLWILPDYESHIPQYGEYKFPWHEREGKWLHMVSDKDGEGQVKIHQDVNIYAAVIEEGHTLAFDVREGRQAYMIQIEGESRVKAIMLQEKDALAINEEEIVVNSVLKSHVLLIEMEKKEI